jgi:two-component system sensor histidine kinase/response regulator
MQFKRIKINSMEINNLQAPVILIVDDNPENLQVLGKLLKDEKYEVEFAIDGESALGWIKEKQFDLLLLDINMPGMTGFEVCKTIRSDPKMNKLPIIFLSAESERDSILKGFDLGGQDYITKPFDGRELIVRAKTHITLKRTRENSSTERS